METDPPSKPEISRKEANWRVHVAGLQAQKEAEAAGIDQATATHLLDGGVGLRISGVTFPPINAGFLMMLPFVESLRDRLVSITQEGGQLAALTFCLGEPEAAWAALRAPDSGASFEAAAFAYASQFTLVDMRQLAKWMALQMAALNEGAEDPGPGKPQASARPPEASPSSPSA